MYNLVKNAIKNKVNCYSWSVVDNNNQYYRVFKSKKSALMYLNNKIADM